MPRLIQGSRGGGGEEDRSFFLDVTRKLLGDGSWVSFPAVPPAPTRTALHVVCP